MSTMCRLCSVSLLSLEAANDNTPPATYDPLDYEDFDPALLPPDMFFGNDEPWDIATIFDRLHD